MSTYKISLALIAMTAMNANAFTTAPAFTSRAATSSMASTMNPNDFYFMDEKDTSESTMPVMQEVAPAQPTAPKKKAAPKKASGHGTEGIFAPVVLTAKTVLGETELNKLRGKVIGEHSKVIGNFVKTSDTAFGQTVLKQLFALADADRNGTLEESELEKFMHTLGFDFLNEKQIRGIFQRADSDKDGHIDLEEWLKDAPKTLKTNLIKLAKKNGAELGFLA